MKCTGVYETWLVDLKKMEIHIPDTTLGRHQETNRRELKDSVHLYTEKPISALETIKVEARDINVDNNLPV